MFYFGRDYLDELSEKRSCRVIVKKGVLTKDDFSSHYNLIEVSNFLYLLLVLYLIITNARIFCPTVHAIPLIRRQVSVLHDMYPFRSRRKLLLLRFMLLISRGHVGGINRSVVLPFLEEVRTRGFYMPNKIASFTRVGGLDRPSQKVIRVGLMGTDSEKKNYAALFEAAAAKQIQLKFYLYGTHTYYAASLLSRFSRQVTIKLVSSDEVSLESFLSCTVDIVVSVGVGEGFCRPVAMATMLGVQTVLIEDPVFREFYSGTSTFVSNVIEALDASQCAVASQRRDEIVLEANKLKQRLDRDSENAACHIVRSLEL